MMQMILVKAVLVGCVWVSVCPACCVCFSRGASTASCLDMKPGHITAQLQHTHSAPAVTIHTSRTVYLPHHTLTVSVRSSRVFMGLLLHARSIAEDRVIGGEFTLHPAGTHTLSCLSAGDTITHSDKLLKRNLSFTWRAPPQPSGDLRFYITVVHSYFIYWTRVRSAVVHDGTRRTQSTGSDSGLQTKIVSASLLKLIDTHIHTSPHRHSLNNTQYSNSTTLTDKLFTHTSPPQHIHTDQRSTTNSHMFTKSHTKELTEDRSYNTQHPCNTTIHCTSNNITHTLQDTNISTQSTSATQKDTNSPVLTQTSPPHTHLQTHTPVDTQPDTSPKTPSQKHTPLPFKRFHTHQPTYTTSDTTTHTSPTYTHLQTHTLTLTYMGPKIPHHKHTPPFTLFHTHQPATETDEHLATTTHTRAHTHMNTHTLKHSTTDVQPQTHTLSLFHAESPGFSPEMLSPTPLSPPPEAFSLTPPSVYQRGVSNGELSPAHTMAPPPHKTTLQLKHNKTMSDTHIHSSTPVTTHTHKIAPVTPHTHKTAPVTPHTHRTAPVTPHTHTTNTPLNITTTSASHIQATHTPPRGTTLMSSLTTHSNSDGMTPLTSRTLNTHTPRSRASTPAPYHQTHIRPPPFTNTHTANVNTHPANTFPTPTAPTYTLFPLPLHTSTLHPSPHPDPSPALRLSLSDPPGESGHDTPLRPGEAAGAPDREGLRPERLPTPELVLLLGLSAALGMAVLVGLRYLQRKYCRKHTAVSLSDRSRDDRGVIHVQECGELVHVRRIRENSFLLLQAEYNLITAPGN